jgi:epoxide hydrolase-like protein
MNNDLEDRTGVPAPLTSRRTFIRAAAAASGAGILSAGMRVSAQGTAAKAEQIVLPTTTKEITPFKVHVPQAALDDLKRRLATVRWPDRGSATDWSQGVPLGKAQALIEYWRTRYDWRRAEISLNALPQFRTQIDGLGIYFIHVRSKHENALPIILTHGWPGSIIEFLQVIEPLVDPTAHGGKADEAFHVVIPSRVWLFGQADRSGLAPSAYCECLGRADGASRLQPLRSTRRRFGRRSIELDGQAAALGACRHSSESSDPLSTTTVTRRLYSRRTAGTRSARQVCERWFWLSVDPGDASPNTGVRSCRLPDWASNVDLREISGMERQQG